MPPKFVTASLRFVDEAPGTATRRVQRVDLPGSGDTTKLVVAFTTTEGTAIQRWAIWDEDKPFDEAWAPPYEVSGDIATELGEILRKPSP